MPDGSAPSLLLTEIAVRNLRNLERVDLTLAPRVNVFAGNNGQGKTSLLEAIYFVATSRSFRTSKLSEMVRHEQSVASVKATLRRTDDELSREQVAALQNGRSVLKLDGSRPSSTAAYATRSPVVVFHPDELALSSGPAQIRRRLLDRIALFLEPSSADTRSRYTRALRGRQELLRRSRTPESGSVDAFEELCARHGAELTRLRARTIDALKGPLAAAFEQIASPDLALAAEYQPGGSEDEQTAREALRDRRDRDAHRPSAGWGPHRDDLVLTLSDRPARVVASQGQHRALTLALKAAEAACLTDISGTQPMLLLDDVSSELDPERTSSLMTFLSVTRSQIFITTTRPELIVTEGVGPPLRRDFRVVEGRISDV